MGENGDALNAQADIRAHGGLEIQCMNRGCTGMKGGGGGVYRHIK